MNNNTTCPSCAAGFDASANPACPNCGFQINAINLPVVFQPVRRVQKSAASVLLALLVDITGSTGKFSDGVRLAPAMIFRTIQAKARTTKVYLHTGGDLDFGQQCTLVCDGGTIDQATPALASLSFGGGGDAPETHLDSIEAVLTTTSWELDPRTWRNAVVGFLTANTKPSRSGVTAEELGAKFKNLGILFYLVAEDFPFARAITDAAGGLFFPISNHPDPAQMQQIASGIGQSILVTATRTATRAMTVPAPGI
jgi:hypothetical protein